MFAQAVSDFGFERSNQAVGRVSVGRFGRNPYIDLTRMGQHADAAGVFTEWLDHDIGGVRARLVWFESLKGKLAAE